MIRKVNSDDLIKFGIIPELIGRLPIVAVLDQLTEEDLINVLTQPKNAIIKQYKKLFEMDKVTLDFKTEALQLIAEKSLKRKSGARGLRSIVEKILLDIMYEIPNSNWKNIEVKRKDNSFIIEKKNDNAQEVVQVKGLKDDKQTPNNKPKTLLDNTKIA